MHTPAGTAAIGLRSHLIIKRRQLKPAGGRSSTPPKPAGPPRDQMLTAAGKLGARPHRALPGKAAIGSSKPSTRPYSKSRPSVLFLKSCSTHCSPGNAILPLLEPLVSKTSIKLVSHLYRSPYKKSRPFLRVLFIYFKVLIKKAGL